MRIIKESATTDIERLLDDGIGRQRTGSVIYRRGSKPSMTLVGQVSAKIKGPDLSISIEVPELDRPMIIPVELRSIRGVTWTDPTLRIDLGPGRIILVTWA